MSPTLEQQTLNAEQALALARIQDLDETTLKVLKEAWSLADRKIVPRFSYIMAKLGVRLIVVKSAYIVLDGLKLWPQHCLNRPQHKKPEPQDPVRAHHAAEEDPDPEVYRPKPEPHATLARTCVREYESAMKRLGKPQH